MDILSGVLIERYMQQIGGMISRTQLLTDESEQIKQFFRGAKEMEEYKEGGRSATTVLGVAFGEKF